MKTILFVLLASFIVIGCGEKAQQTTKAPKPLDRKEKAEQIRQGANGQATLVDLSPLQGRKLADLYAKFLGIPNGVVPKNASIDFERNHAHLWAGKIERRDSSDSTQANVDKILTYYRENKNKMNLKEFVTLADKEVARTKTSIDWFKLCRLERLDENRCQIFRAIAKDIVGKDIVAYGMTEIFPSADGKLNVTYLDLLLRQAGAEYVDSLPATHDGYLSFGLYQFTSLALHDAKGERRGASLVNQAVAGDARIPGSVILLRNGDHHRAAYMFAIHNVATLLRLANKKEVAILGKLHREHQDEMVQFIATAHHLPGHAIKYTRYWIAGGMKKNLESSMGRILGKYAHKTQANLLALYTAIK